MASQFQPAPDYTFPIFGTYNFAHRTWDTQVYVQVYIDTPSSAFYAYDIKYFFHIRGGSDPDGTFLQWYIAHAPGEAKVETVTISVGNCQAGQTYDMGLELWWSTGGDLAPSQVTYSFSFQIKDPIFLWRWDSSNSNFSSSWIDYNAHDLISDLDSSNQALHTGGRTIDFKRTIWNQMINWMINTYNVAKNQHRNESYFNPNATAYMSLTGDGIFKADHWNAMRNIANATARALGGSDFLNVTVNKGDPLTAQIFKDVTENLNTYIIGYAT